MRLKKLHIQNVASYADVSIDFSADPLATTPLFLIAGDVGSGKSTILDAITLALYNRTPRLNDKSQRRGALDNEFEGHKATHTVNLVRRGQKNATITLDFEADGHSWRARWTASAKARSASLQLTNLTTGAVFEKDAHLTEIQRLTGLNFDQFCRTTVLAQGAFAEFLKANEEEKSEILEKILSDDRFSRIGRSIYRLSAEAGQKLREKEKDLERLKTMTAEERTQAEIEKHKLFDDAALIKERCDVLTTEHAWLARSDELTQQESVASKKLEAAELNDKSEEMVALRADLNDYDATVDVRQAVAARTACCGELEQEQSNLDALKARYGVALKCVAQAKASLQRLNNEREKKAEVIALHSDRTAIYASIQSLSKDAETYRKVSAECTQASKRILKLRDEIKVNLEPALKEASDKVLIADGLLKSAVTEHNSVRKKLESAGLAKLRVRHTEAVEWFNTLETIKIYCDQIDKEKATAADWKQEIDKLNARIDELPELITSATEQYNRLTEESTRLTQELSIRRMAIEDLVVKIRARLHPGDECPVCGRPVDSHLPVDDAVRATITEQEQTLAQLNKRVEDARVKLTRLTTSFDDARANLSKANMRYKEALKRIENIRLKVEDLNMLDRDILSTAIRQATTSKDELDKQLKEAEKIERQAESIRLDVERRRDEYEKARTAEDATRKQIELREAEIVTCQALATSKQSDATLALNAITTAVSAYPAYKSLAGKDVTALIDTIGKDSTEYAALVKEAEEINTEIASLDQEIQQASNTNLRIIESMPDWAVITPAQKSAQDKPAETMAELKADLDIVLERRRLTTDRYEKAHATLKSYLATPKAVTEERLLSLCRLTPDIIAEMRRRISDSQTELSVAQSTLQHISEQILKHNQDCPPRIKVIRDEGLPLPEIEDIYVKLQESKKSLDDTNLRLGHLTAVLDDDDARARQRQELRQQHQQAKIDADRWSTLNRMFGSEDGKRFRCIALSFVLGSLIEAANTYMERLSDRYRLQLKPGTYVILVEDRFDGGRLRQITTLSGGETFIVSLAMALALSDIGEVSGSDILFIDEGFGSLGGEDLHKAIQALQSLHTLRSRRVGIISHIPEVAERIPVQIRVDRPAESARATIRILS